MRGIKQIGNMYEYHKKCKITIHVFHNQFEPFVLNNDVNHEEIISLTDISIKG